MPLKVVRIAVVTVSDNARSCIFRIVVVLVFSVLFASACRADSRYCWLTNNTILRIDDSETAGSLIRAFIIVGGKAIESESIELALNRLYTAGGYSASHVGSKSLGVAVDYTARTRRLAVLASVKQPFNTDVDEYHTRCFLFGVSRSWRLSSPVVVYFSSDDASDWSRIWSGVKWSPDGKKLLITSDSAYEEVTCPISR